MGEPDITVGILFFILIHACMCTRIGLPEDHLDTSACFDRACISESDWSEIGDKWLNFKDTVKVMDESNATKIRASIWQTFNNGRIWNGDANEIAKGLKEIRNTRTFLDKRTEEIRDLQLKDATTRYDHQAIIAMEGDVTVQKAAYFLYNKHPTVSTLYEYNPKTDTLRVVAGEEHILGIRSRVQIVGHGRDFSGEMKLSEKTPSQLSEVVRKLTIESSELGRVSLVGCNVDKVGQSEFLNDGFTEQFLKSLRFHDEVPIRTEVSSRSGLVSVTSSGRKETGEITTEGIQWFSKDPLSKTIMTLGEFDEIIRTELPVTDRIATYNQESSGALVKVTDIDPSRSLQDNIKPVYIEKADGNSANIEIMKKISARDLGEFINTVTRSNFIHELDFVKQNVIERGQNTEAIKTEIEKTIKSDNIPENELMIEQLRKVQLNQPNSKLLSHNEFRGKAYLNDPVNNKRISNIFDFTIQLNEEGSIRIDLASANKNIKTFLLDSGVSPTWKYVARLNNAYQRVINVENVRTIQNRADLIYEINLLGTFGVDYRNGESLSRYYRFGDVVYRMGRSNFYITWEGMIASDSPVIGQHFNDKIVRENQVQNVKSWMWSDNFGRYDFPRESNFETYPDMLRKIKNQYKYDAIKNQIDYWNRQGYNVHELKRNTYFNDEEVSFTLVDRGWSKNYRLKYDSGKILKLMNDFSNGEHLNIQDNLVHVLEGSTVLAIGLSEPIRNFRSFSINEMLIHLNEINSISLSRLIEAHPMTRGKSWGLVRETGLTVVEYGHRRQQGELVLPRELNIARTFLLSRKGHDEISKYRFLTESEYHAIERQMPPGDLAKITGSIQTADIRNTLAEFKPQLTDASIRTNPLGTNEFPTLTDLEVYSDNSQAKSLPIRASVSLVNDYILLTNHISTAIAQKSLITGRDYEIVESSVEVENNNIKLIVRDKANPNLEEEVNLKIDEDSLTSNKIKEEANMKLEDIQNTKNVPSKSLTTVNEFLGVYGIVMGFRGAVQDFEDGKIFEGVMNVAQSVHGIYGMSQTAQRAVQKISSSFFSKGLEEVETGLTVATTEMTTALTEGTTAAEEAVTVAGEAAGDIPILGTIFGVYNTIQDLRRGTAIGYVDAALDAAIVISAFFGPEALVVTVALTIVRLVIDDFYYAISNELKNLPADATVLQKIGAVFKGIAEGIVMVIKNIVDFLSLGFLSFAETSSKIDKQYSKDRALLHKMSDYHNYFNVEKEEGSHQKLIDFASGEESWNGGNIIFHLYEDNTARLRMQIVDDGGNEQILDKHISLGEGANDIVLGIGESHDISFKKQSAKIFWFIPVHSRNLISQVRGDQGSLHGTYYGNSKSNKFFTIQKLPEGADLGYSLTDYYYEMYGEDGDDIFYLGPQKSVVNGGNGRDTYIIPYSGGRTEINNYAEDLLEDVLFMQVDFDQIYIDRNGNDLSLQHGNNHDVVVKSWFSGHRMGHLTFKANNGVIFNVTIGVHGKASIVPLAIILSGETDGHTVDVSKGVWKNVMLITGSDGSDFIKANDNNNMLDGGKGFNTIEGGAGSDTYLIHSVDKSETSDWNEINNFDPKMTVDKVIFDIPFSDIIPNPFGQDFRLYTNSRNGPKVLLKNWFSNEHFRHMLFVTTDDVIFKLTDDINDPVLLHPIILDASNEKSKVTLDASKPEFVNVSTIIGSNYDDTIVGNNGNNYMKGGQGSDRVSGGEGRDVYVIRQEDIGDFINNFAEDRKNDLILADFNYNDISVTVNNYDVEVQISRRRIFTIIDWIKGENWQHVTVRTIDGISFKLDKDGKAGIKKTPIEIDKSEKTTRQEVRTHKRSMRSVEYIIGSNATDFLMGNKRSNRIDPGFGGAYMMALEGHDQYVIMDHYNGPNIVNNFAWDNFTDTVKLPAYFNDITTNVSGEDIIVSSSTNPSATVNLEKYTSDPYRRHLVVNTVKDGVMFTLPPSRNFEPAPISLDRSNQAHNLIVDLNINYLWRDVVTVVGTKDHSNVIRGNSQNNTITGGELSDTLEGGEGNDVIRGNEGDDFIDGGEGDDTLAGGAGEDWIDGGIGNDVIYPGPGGDHVKGGPGFDVIVVFGDAYDTTGVFIDLLNGHGFGGDAQGDIYVSVEGIIGGFYGDILVGDHNDNYLDGKEGNDILFPLDGNDILVGGDGKDMYEIGDIRGEKVIRNIAEDGIMDYVNLKFYESDLVYLERRSDDLVLHVGVFLDGVFCPKSNTGPYRFDQWYKGVRYQHITIQLAGEEVVFNDFRTGRLDVHVERPDTESRRKKCDEILERMMDYGDYYY